MHSNCVMALTHPREAGMSAERFHELLQNAEKMIQNLLTAEGIDHTAVHVTFVTEEDEAKSSEVYLYEVVVMLPGASDNHNLHALEERLTQAFELSGYTIPQLARVRGPVHSTTEICFTLRQIDDQLDN